MESRFLVRLTVYHFITNLISYKQDKNDLFDLIFTWYLYKTLTQICAVNTT